MSILQHDHAPLQLIHTEMKLGGAPTPPQHWFGRNGTAPATNHVAGGKSHQI